MANKYDELIEAMRVYNSVYAEQDAKELARVAEKHLAELDKNDFTGLLQEMNIWDVVSAVADIGIPMDQLFSQESPKGKELQQQLDYGAKLCDIVKANSDIFALSFNGSNGIYLMRYERAPGTKLEISVSTFFSEATRKPGDPAYISFHIESTSRKPEVFLKELKKAGFDEEDAKKWKVHAEPNFNYASFHPAVDDKDAIDYAINTVRKLLGGK